MERMPAVSTSAYVNESASIIGDVRIGERVYVAPDVSLRTDKATPIIRRRVQHPGMRCISWHIRQHHYSGKEDFICTWRNNSRAHCDKRPMLFGLQFPKFMPQTWEKDVLWAMEPL